MKKIIFILLLSSPALHLFAQQNFVAKGRVEFEKKENLKKELDSWVDDNDEGDNSFIEQIKKTVPQFKLSYFNLYFDENHSIYKPGRESDQKIPDFLARSVTDNIIYNDFARQQTTAQKTVFNTSFILTDSMRHLDWRITNEVRTIAGFECRKATAVMFDSVYVIAFYTDQILASAGPESFSGLPGMILGLAIPRINSTWFATKLELVPVTDKDVAIPVKGKKMTTPEFKTMLKDRMKDWGKYGQRNLLLVSI